MNKLTCYISKKPLESPIYHHRYLKIAWYTRNIDLEGHAGWHKWVRDCITLADVPFPPSDFFHFKAVFGKNLNNMFLAQIQGLVPPSEKPWIHHYIRYNLVERPESHINVQDPHFFHRWRRCRRRDRDACVRRVRRSGTAGWRPQRTRRSSRRSNPSSCTNPTEPWSVSWPRLATMADKIKKISSRISWIKNTDINRISCHCTVRLVPPKGKFYKYLKLNAGGVNWLEGWAGVAKQQDRCEPEVLVSHQHFFLVPGLRQGTPENLRDSPS